MFRRSCSSLYRLSAPALFALLVMLVLPGQILGDGHPGGKPVSKPPRPSTAVTFQLFPNATFIPCLAADPSTTPTVNAFVRHGELNDQMVLILRGFKPGLNFDLFTVEHSPQLADGSKDPNFQNFGLAWYQSDIHIDELDEDESDEDQSSKVAIRTILLNQIFGFDPAVNLPPTNTFHVGFWFNDPADAAACGFTGFTPFNGEHHAGPLAFITRPNADTGFGPLCTNPDTSTSPPTCNP